MRSAWLYWLMLLVAAPSLVFVGLSVATQLPHTLSDPDNQDRDQLLAWAAVVGVGVLSILASLVCRARGRQRAAIALVAVVALPALFGIGLALFVVLLFILKGM